ncbi:hypothetical protein [Massilia sp. SYSU DXS3249]
MQVKHFADRVPAFRFATKTLCAIGLAAQIAGCSSDADLAETKKKLEQANEKIVALEAQLARAQVSAPVATAAPVAQDPAAPAVVTSTPDEEPKTAAGQQWSYYVVEEKMTGGKRKTASVESTNTVDFDFPYSGSQHGRITLRIDPRHGKDVLFRIERGQILCPSYEGCRVQIRFDDEKPSSFAASAAADHSSDVIFLDDYPRFLTKLRKAKRVRVAVNIYQQGTPVFEFDVSGFDLDKYQAKS